MSDIMTVIKLPGHCGIAEWGELSAQEAIKKVRDYYEHKLKEAETCLGAKDEDFEIEVVRGVHVQRHIKWLQNPAKKFRG